MATPSRAVRALLGTIATLVVLAISGTANAKFVPVTFDPTYFDGFGHFTVPDSPDPCASLSAGIHAVNLGFTVCNGVILDDVSVNVDDGLGDTGHLSLPSPSDLIVAMVVDPTAPSYVVGIDSLLIPLSITDCSSGPDDPCDYDWFIDFISIVTPTRNNPLKGLLNEVVLLREPTDCEQSYSSDSLYNSNHNHQPDCVPVPFGSPATNVSFTPEPGSLALMGGALVAGWIARKRKRGSSAS
ncbi:MAG TPA: PEP-CTERM sorting domain-containing protein [Casimicrobiaceae bacterium]|nr:PEP-CTERM sorting domain-containing protein [Casimicrobiaceae bacterium]